MSRRFSAFFAALLFLAFALPAAAANVNPNAVTVRTVHGVTGLDQAIFAQGEPAAAIEARADPFNGITAFEWISPGEVLQYTSPIINNVGGVSLFTIPANATLGAWRVDVTYDNNGRRTVAATVAFTVIAGAPPPPKDGACGSDNGVLMTAAPANFCSAGAVSGYSINPTTYTWSCDGANGGLTASCSAPRGFTVTSTAGFNGSVSPASQSVAAGTTATVVLTPASGYRALSATTTCESAFTQSADVVQVAEVWDDCSVDATFEFARLAQSITFATPADATLGDAPRAIAGSASSGLPVSYTSTTPFVCTVAGNLPKKLQKTFVPAPSVVTFVGMGLCTIVASQKGDKTWLAAANEPRSFTVRSAKVATSLSLSSSMNPERYGRPLVLIATIASSEAANQGFVSFSADFAVVPGCGSVAVSNSVATCTTADLPSGVRSLAAGYSGDERHEASSSAFMKQYIKAYLQGNFRDLDADGTTDMVLRRPDGALIARLVGGTSVYRETGLLPAGTPWEVIHFGDISQDAKADIILRKPDGEIAVWLMDGTLVAVKYTAVDAGEGLAFVGVADFDGDGRDELILRDAGGKLWMRVLTDGGVKATLPLPESFAGLQVVRVADFDGDGRDDLLLADANGALSMELMRGDKSVRFTPPLPAGYTADRLTHVGDFDGDGKLDLLFRDASGHIMSWKMSELAASAPVLVMADTKWTVTHVGDFDGDGTHDLVLRAADGEIAVRLMDDGAALPSTRAYPLSGYKVVQVGDYNGDGVSDLLLEGPQHQLVIWVMNRDNIIGEATAVGASEWIVYP